MSGAEQTVARRVVVGGRVQGVFFRASTRRQADRHEVVGWVRNRSDGAVEAHLEGAPVSVDAVESWMRGGGPSHARVDEDSAESVEVDGHTDFEVRH